MVPAASGACLDRPRGSTAPNPQSIHNVTCIRVLKDIARQFDADVTHARIGCGRANTRALRASS